MTTRASVERPELLLVEALVPEAGVEAFHEAVLPGTARVDVDGLDVVVGQPAVDLVGD